MPFLQKIWPWLRIAFVFLLGVAKHFWVLLVKFAKRSLRGATPVAKNGWVRTTSAFSRGSTSISSIVRWGIGVAIIFLAGVVKSLWVLLVKFAKRSLRGATPVAKNGWVRTTSAFSGGSTSISSIARWGFGVAIIFISVVVVLRGPPQKEPEVPGEGWDWGWVPEIPLSFPSWLWWLVALALFAFNLYRLGIRHPFRAFFRAVWQTIVVWVVFSIALWGWRTLGIPEKLPSFPTDIDLGWWIQQPHLILLALSSAASLGLWMGLKNEGFRRRHAGLLPGETFLNYTTSSERLVYFSRFYKRVLSAQRRSILFVAPIVILWLARAQGNVIGDPWWLWVYEGLPALLVTIAIAAVALLDPSARSTERHPSFQRLNLWDYILIFWGLVALFSTFQYAFW